MRQLAIMRGVNFGLRDVGTPVLWFTVHVSEGSAALQVLADEEMKTLLKNAGCYSITELEGKACWVERDAGMIAFKGFAKI